MMPSVLSWLLGMMGAGVAMILFGLRGRRVGDQPACGACGFDLGASAEGTETCTECGSGLKRPGAVRRGRRRRRPIVIALGALMVLAPLGLLGAVGYAILTGVNLDTHKPIAVLKWELERAGSSRSRSIAEELRDRLTRKETPRRQYDQIVDLALEVQGNTAHPWSTAWGEVIAEADMSSRLNKERSERFRRQAAILDIRARPRVRIGEVLPVSVLMKESRVGAATDLVTMVHSAECRLDGEVLNEALPTDRRNDLRRAHPASGYVVMLYHTRPRGMSYGARGLLLKLPESAKPGLYSLRVKLAVDTRSSRMGVVLGTKSSAKSSADSKSVEVELPVELVEGPTVELAPPDKAVSQLMELRLEPIRVMNGGIYSAAGRDAATIHFNIADLPLGVDFGVKLRSGQRTWDMGRLSSGTTCEMTELDYIYGFSGSDRVLSSAESLSTEHVDVILTPNAAAAAKTVDLFRIFGEEIVYKDVEVSKPVARR